MDELVNTIAGVGNAIFGSGGPTSAQGIKSNDQSPAEAATSAQEFSAQEAQKNRDYQTQMSNTSYQRGTADMKAAGINPLLAFQQGGASTPSGSTGSGYQAPSQTSAQTKQSSASTIGSLATTAFMLGKMFLK